MIQILIWCIIEWYLQNCKIQIQE